MKSTVPVGTGRAVRHRLEIEALATSGTRRTRVHRRGHRGTRLHASRPHGGRRVRRRVTATSSRRCTTASTLGSSIRCHVGGDGQARRECRARDTGELHHRDRERLRGDRSGRRRVAEGSASIVHRLVVPPRRHRRWRFVLLKDSLALKQLAANSGYNFQLMNAVIEVNSSRSAASSGSSSAGFGPLRGKRLGLLGLASSREPTTWGRRAWCSPAACSPRAPR